MLSLFRSNHPAAIIALLIYALLLKIQILLTPVEIEYSNIAPLAELFFWLTGFLGNTNFSNGLVVYFLIFIQALLFNRIFNRFKFFSQTTFIPALAFILLTTVFHQLSVLSPVLIANLFLLFVVDKIFQLYKKDDCYSQVFNIGFLIGIASLLYFPAIFLFILFVISLIVLRTFIWREWVIGFFGLLTPYLILSTYYYWNDELVVFLSDHFITNFQPARNMIVFDEQLIIKSSFVLIILIWAFLRFRVNYLKSGIQTQKFSVILNFFLIIGLGSFFAQSEWWLSHCMLVTIPLSCFMAYYFLETKNKALTEVIHLLMLMLIFYYQYVGYFLQ